MRVQGKSFMKGVLRLALFNVIVYQVWQMIIFTLYQAEATTLTENVYQFWGLEVGLLMIKKILDDYRAAKAKKQEEYEYEEV